jgi:hypothetical protein
VLEGDVGVGFLEVGHEPISHDGPGRERNDRGEVEGNAACIGGSARAGVGVGPVG